MIDETRLSEVEEGTREQLAQQCRIAFSVAYVCWFQFPRGRQNQTSNIFSIQLLGSFFQNREPDQLLLVFKTWLLIHRRLLAT